MLYDSLRYVRQSKDIENNNRKEHNFSNSDEFLSGLRKKDKISVVITLVIYYGEKDWDGPTCLSDMMEIPEEFKEFFNDYKLHLLQVKNINNFSFQNKDNKDFFTMINEFYCNGNRLNLEDFRRKYPGLEIYWETLAAIGAATGTTEFIENHHFFCP